MNILMKTKTVATLAAFTIGLSSNAAFADYQFRKNYSDIEVTVTNITQNQTFTPILAASLKRELDLFNLGEQASEELVAIAESGNVAPMTELLSANDKVSDVQNSAGLLGPGESVTITLRAPRHTNRISLAAMMLPTNDSFIALNSVRVPSRGRTETFLSPGYDAGSETNDESCLNIPGPYCGGAALSPEDAGEGYVHISRGISGNGDLSVSEFDWRNPVAKISVRRVRAK